MISYLRYNGSNGGEQTERFAMLKLKTILSHLAKSVGKTLQIRHQSPYDLENGTF